MGRRNGRGGLEGVVLSLALLVPLAVAAIGVQQLATVSLAAPSISLSRGDTSALSTKPIVTRFEVPPTLVPPTATPRPTATPAPSPTTAPSPTPRATTYTVQKGDELKHIAAQYQVDIFKLIRANDIPNPDSLRIGQVLRIPED